MASPAVQAAITPGTYAIDPVHSNVTFSVRHFGAGRFRGAFSDFDARLVVDERGELALTGTVKVASIEVKEPRLAGHLQSPDFFDAARYPEITFVSTSITVDGEGGLEADGELTLKATTKPVHAHGELTYTADDGHGGERAGVELTTTIDRTQYGVDFNAQLPGGAPVAANEVTLLVELELKKEA